MRWVTSDLHFGHKNILKYSPDVRGHYKDIDDMDSSMIEEWNSTVAPEDTIYILGDVSFRKPDATVEIVRSLTGHKHLIKGNHDEKSVKNQDFLDCFDSVQDYLEIGDKEHKVLVVMFHYPIAVWNQCHRGSLLLHGHCHGGASGLEGYRAVDVGYDATGQLLSSYDEIIVRAKQNPPLKRDY